MTRNKAESHEKIIKAALNEFMEYGFKDASMRRIAAACGMSVSGLYKHFPSKEEMFVALVEPAYNGLKEKYYASIETEFEKIDEEYADHLWEDGNEILWVVNYIYENYDAFKLIVCKSQGTRYENYVHELTVIEEESMEKYFKKMDSLGIVFNKLSKKEYHTFTTTNINAIFQVVEHDFSKKEALTYAKHLDAYNLAGWKELFKNA